MPPQGPRPTARKRAADAYRLRCTGRTWQEIADALKYGSPASAHAAVVKHISRMPAEDVEMARAMSAGNYRQVIGELYAVATRAKASNKLTTAVQALEAVANVQDKHDRLTGLHLIQPTKIDVNVTSAVAVIDNAEEQLRAILAARAPQIAIPAPAPTPATPVIDAEVIEP
ncbi:hypothetical protein [Mycolicibacterium mucogenicum]|uniref:Uncharacterized protein n=2 Tax=Mycolicibacterium mucogenicum DSM 44124 TaxID=1226753 RepID=A0A8E4W3A4_MYCMU|nr:hypothetical protein [Mycolicibacterium mucogenicum]KAB7761779.1 hypothetical protein MMUC44124_01030 [Mycolicibacterium mucogenicum DSM 44124]QPG70012.1 hypothetical protein C1S78_003005 [Mycolicibacterium mucogenicum DSM 44124]